MIKKSKKILKNIIHIKKNKKRKFFFGKNFWMGFLSLFLLTTGSLVVWLSLMDIPDFNDFEDRKIVNSTKIYDRTGEVLLYDIHADTKRTSIPFGDMGVNIKNATVAIEDAEFYQHSGVRVTSTIRAVLSNIFNIGIGGGGSTITQQLIKNTLLTSEKKISRKIKEWVLAIKIEQKLTKEKILELYLNEAPYGGTIYGIEEASKTYFGKHSYDLNVTEAAYMAAVPQSPTKLSPYGKNRDKLDERKNLVLFRMKQLGYINQEEYDKAKNEVVVFLPKEAGGIKAPHFVFFIKDYLEKKYGEEAVEERGLRVTTTLDYDLQQKAEEYVKNGALQNEKDWNGSNAALVAIDPKTGHLITMVGSRDYNDKLVDGNFNVGTAVRQPGSSFKPFIYATAFNKGFTPDTVLFDVPTEFQTTCDPYGKALPGRDQANCYMPDNYDGKFRGPLSLRNALAQSINIPAVKLFYLSGLKDSLKTAEEMGITTLSDINRYGLTLVIGGGEVSLLDITSAYSVFANSGIKNKYTGILKVEDRDGNILEEYKPNPVDVLPRNTALLVSDILSDNTARTPTFGSNSSLVVSGHQVAVKTGTTNNNKDAWTVGYTPSIAVGVWAGNNDNKPMKKGGSAVAGPIWNNFISYALTKLPEEKFEKPDIYFDPSEYKPVLRGLWQGNESFYVDKLTGALATNLTPKETRVEKVLTNVHSILYWVNKNNIMGPPPTNPSNDPQFSHWEVGVQNWWKNNSYRYGNDFIYTKPSETDRLHTEGSKPKVEIIQPNSDTYYNANELISLQANSSGAYPITKADVLINGIYLDTISIPFSYSFIPNKLTNLSDNNEFKLIVYDSVYNKTESVVHFKVR